MQKGAKSRNHAHRECWNVLKSPYAENKAHFTTKDTDAESLQTKSVIQASVSKLIHLRFRALPAGRSIGRRLRTQPGFMSRKRTRAALVITCSVSASGGKGPQAEAATGYSGSEGYGRGGEGLNRPNAKTNAANETNKGPADGSGTATIVSTHTPGSDVTDPSPTIGPS
jgi:hypothetical protein